MALVSIACAVIAGCFVDDRQSSVGLTTSSPSGPVDGSTGGPSPGVPDPPQASSSTGSGADETTTGDEPGGTPEDPPTSGADDPVGSTGDGGTQTPDQDSVSACCSPSATGGCDDAPIEACVCAQDDYCCSGQWDIACVTEVEDFGCGSCGNTDEIATCHAFCSTLLECQPDVPFVDVDTCVYTECTGLLDQAQAHSAACLDAMSQLYACVGLLACAGYDNYITMNPPDGYPCRGFQTAMLDLCPFLAG